MEYKYFYKCKMNIN